MPLKVKFRLSLVAAALVTCTPGVAPASAADRVIAMSPPVAYAGGLGSVDAYGGSLVWSQQTLSGFDYFVRDARGTRRLLTGKTRDDLDLGARRGGGTQAVFTSLNQLFSYDFRSGATRRLSSLSRPHGFEQRPSVWKGRFAFVRVGEDDDPAPRPKVPGLFATRPLRAVTRASAVATDLRGSRLAYVTLKSRTTTLYLATLPRGRARVRSCFIARATGARGAGPSIELSSPVMTATHVYWLRKDTRVSRATIRRRRLPRSGCRLGGREEHSREIAGIESFATDRGRFFYSAQNQVREATDPRLAFTR